MNIIHISKNTFLIETSLVKAIVRKNIGWIIRKKGKKIDIQPNITKQTLRRYKNYLIEHQKLDHYFI